VKRGRRISRERRVLANLGLVRSLVVAKYGPSAAHDDDLFQAGVVGLLLAVDAHEAGQVTGRFSSYARTCIISELARYALASGRRLLPHRQYYERISIQRLAQQLAHTLGRDPTIGELISAWPRNGARPPRRGAFERALEPDPLVVVTDNPESDVELLTDELDIEDLIDAKRQFERMSPAEQARLLRGGERA